MNGDDRPYLAAYRDHLDEFSPEEQIARQAAQMREDFGHVQPADLDKIWLYEIAERFKAGMTDAAENQKMGLELWRRGASVIGNWVAMALIEGLDDERVKKEYLAARGWYQFMDEVEIIIREGKEVDKRQQEGVEQP
jgi:hypothetical protein